jgi:hypothetical protein
MKGFKPEKFIGDLTQKAGETIEESKEKLAAAKEVTKYQASGVKSELSDLKRIFQSKDIIFYKTDALAVVLRKLGGLDEFLAAVDKLTKEGYLLVAWEDVRSLPWGIGTSMLGTFYIFQRSKYV